MRAKVLKLSRGEKRRLQRRKRKTKDPGELTRILIVLAYGSGKQTGEIAEILGYDPSGVRKVRQRYEQGGEASLDDGRADNGLRKVDEEHLEALKLALIQTPKDFEYHRTTWTQECLALAMEAITNLRVHRSTIARALAHLGARWGSPKPVVACP